MASFIVEVKNISPFWNGKRGVLLDCCFENWYNVLVNGTRLVLHPTEFEVIRIKK